MSNIEQMPNPDVENENEEDIIEKGESDKEFVDDMVKDEKDFWLN